jgi:excisionase family DNA binding protein
MEEQISFPDGTNDKPLTVDEAAELLRLTPATIRRYLTAGRFQRFKVGNRTRLSRTEVLSRVSPGRTAWRSNAFKPKPAHNPWSRFLPLIVLPSNVRRGIAGPAA